MKTCTFRKFRISSLLFNWIFESRPYIVGYHERHLLHVYSHCMLSGTGISYASYTNAWWRNKASIAGRNGLSLDSSCLIHGEVGARAVCTGMGKKRMTRKSEIPRMRRRRVAMTLGRVLTRMFHLFVPNNSSGNFFLAVFLRIHSPRPSNRAPPFYTDVLYGRCIQGCSNKHEKFFDFIREISSWRLYLRTLLIFHFGCPIYIK